MDDQTSNDCRCRVMRSASIAEDLLHSFKMLPLE